MNNFKLIILLLGFLMVSCNQKKDQLFISAKPSKTGLSFKNRITETNELNILDYIYFYNGGGVAIGDINNDDLPDIFFSGNQVKNKLYLNKGNLQFEDITDKANVSGNSSWNTGAIMGDVNGDGLLDIYVCAVVGLNGFNGRNELYINNGDETFTESAKKYILDYDSYSSSAAFLDYDLDGDLDIYLLNHAVHTDDSYKGVKIRQKRNHKTGDKLLRNDGGTFTNVSEDAGIISSISGYGLGVAIADFNQDAYPDIYVSNDFYEDDYYYINNGDGTFSEKLRDYFGHTSRFSMGNDAADINHDGWPDIMSLDMLPEDEVILKSSQSDDNVQTQNVRKLMFGYHYQFTRNMLHINQQNSNYLETGLMSGIAATDWSWSSLFADYNQDGEQDIFITNGILKRPNDLDFTNFFSNEKIQNNINDSKLMNQESLDAMPSGKVSNYMFKGGKNLMFEDVSEQWIPMDKQVSGATAIGDLDNDGDLDIVVSNLNERVSLYVNQANNKTTDSTSYLKLKFKYSKPNTFGIGTKVFAYYKDKLQYKELYTARGFQSSSEPIVHFGFGSIKNIDSLKIIWPNKTSQTIKDISLNQTLTIKPENTKPFNYKSLHNQQKTLFKKLDDNLGIDFAHKEDKYLDFNRQKLIPYRVSDRGPAVAIGDLNNDGKDDVYFGGSKLKAQKVFFQTDTIFKENRINLFANDSIKEDVRAIIADFNNDDKNDIIIGSGGGDFSNKTKPLLDSYFTQTNTGFKSIKLPEFYENASVIIANDVDNDDDLDVFIGSNSVSNDFGSIPNSYILKNDSGNFSVLKNEALQKAGMITDAIWSDFNKDGQNDLIVVGEWMSPKFFKNNNGVFTEEKLLDSNIKGLWQQIEPFDIDGDGDTDYLLGNWGTNSKFKASAEHPMRMYHDDFDKNGRTETIVCTYKNGAYYPLLGLDDLAGQMVALHKIYTSYKDFAGQPIEAILSENLIKKANLLEIEELKSGYLKNENNRFTFVPFKNELQVSPITSFLSFDFDADGKNEVLAAGNYFGVTPFHGKFDSFPGALINTENDITLGNKIGLDFSDKAIKNLSIITLNNKPYLLTTINNDKAQVYELIK
ncbi:VCBS repeat-containing protein [Sabulilitoribacter arenilitoris]|uniref:VCBS repeat-containing protein n=1 Tax=Wocania arenilitoris TaxID=2044858 RepID=A0AAE3EMD0_9FLAO|nr:VCBS repeat-containing protein [Wocania arenilitoris]MCF7568055.1 VCBS repeat-containing protein [Wocania arenilitoris]